MTNQLFLRFLLLPICVALGAGCGGSGEPASQGLGASLPPYIAAALRQGEEFELISLDPQSELEKGESSAAETKAAEVEKLAEWTILGKTTITDRAIRERLVAALEKGVYESDGAVAACFWPRHAIRVRYWGKNFELVICFQCQAAGFTINAVASGGF